MAMIVFEEEIFDKYYSSYDKRVDINKDAGGKGTWERFNEVVGADIDTGAIALIKGLIANVIMPITCLERYVPFLESELGYDERNLTLRLSSNIAMRRAVLKILPKLANIKGTIRCYEVLFSKLGMTIVLTEYGDESGFDSAITLDDPNRRFDSMCPACSDYSLAITGTAEITDSVLAAFKSIIAYTEPINARLRSATYNGDDVPELAGDFNTDYSDDYSI